MQRTTQTPRNSGSAALEAAFAILDRWGCTPAEQATLLGIDTSALAEYQRAPRAMMLPADLLERASCLLTIHAALRTLFSFDESIYGWIRRNNSGPFYGGRSALDVMLEGQLSDLYGVARRLIAEVG